MHTSLELLNLSGKLNILLIYNELLLVITFALKFVLFGIIIVTHTGFHLVCILVNLFPNFFFKSLSFLKC